MKDRQLIPGETTHFRWLGDYCDWDLTIGKIYKITKWKGSFYFFLDDVEVKHMWNDQFGTEGVSYEECLKKVLK